VKAAIIGPEGGDTIHLGPVRMRILEDGSTTGHRPGDPLRHCPGHRLRRLTDYVD
jgi:hypothetical protein